MRVRVQVQDWGRIIRGHVSTFAFGHRLVASFEWIGDTDSCPLFITAAWISKHPVRVLLPKWVMEAGNGGWNSLLSFRFEFDFEFGPAALMVDPGLAAGPGPSLGVKMRFGGAGPFRWTMRCNPGTPSSRWLSTCAGGSRG